MELYYEFGGEGEPEEYGYEPEEEEIARVLKRLPVRLLLEYVDNLPTERRSELLCELEADSFYEIALDKLAEGISGQAECVEYFYGYLRDSFYLEAAYEYADRSEAAEYLRYNFG